MQLPPRYTSSLRRADSVLDQSSLVQQLAIQHHHHHHLAPAPLPPPTLPGHLLVAAYAKLESAHPERYPSYFLRTLHASVGQRGTAEIALPGAEIQPRHATIAYNFCLQRFELTVLAHAGAVVNGARVDRNVAAELQHFSRITIGTCSFHFLLPRAHDPDVVFRSYLTSPSDAPAFPYPHVRAPASPAGPVGPLMSGLAQPVVEHHHHHHRGGLPSCRSVAKKAFEEDVEDGEARPRKKLRAIVSGGGGMGAL
ncbi:hypothetical protein H9P43_003932 [Blastocladiella emersonii ATCC 22665]|nr:hypothetical protein H9P43_003932 [Blastocladiella emersonii ATCC 22665]